MKQVTHRSRTRQHSRHARRPSFSVPASLYSRPLPKLLIAAALVVVAWQIVSDTAADTLAGTDPERALAWSRDHAGALVALADREANPPPPTDSSGQGGSSGAAAFDAGTVAALAGRALTADPLDEDALRLLAVAAEAKNDATGARALMELAVQRSRRDLEAQGWLLNAKLTEGDFEGALTNVDAILRTWPPGTEYLFPVLSGLASDPASVKPLVALLAENPPWRAAFTAAFPQQTVDLDAMHAVYFGLRAGPTPPTPPELRAYLTRLIALGQASLAYATMVDFLPADRSSAFGNVYNGGFEDALNGTPFDWTIENVRGADTEIVTGGESGHALRVQFYNTRVPYQHTWQTLILRPGSYRISGRVRAVALQNERGLEWKLYCTGGDRRTLAETERISGTVAWREFETTFDVPDVSGCATQMLRLAIPWRVESEQQISGEIWYDDLAIVPAAAPQASNPDAPTSAPASAE